jgi:hypothetical protein
MTATSILAVIGVIISFYKVLSAPREYFNGLFKSINDKSKTDSLYIIIAVFTIIGGTSYFLFDMELAELDIVVVCFMNLVLIWKAFEILQSPMKYFKGLFLSHEKATRTTFEPITMVIISLIVNYAYFF